MIAVFFAAPLTRGEANAVSGGLVFPRADTKKQTPRSPRLRGAHAPLVRGAANPC
jgi:hypothetical protein